MLLSAAWWFAHRYRLRKLVERRVKYGQLVWEPDRTESALKMALGLAAAASPPEQTREIIAAVRRELTGTDVLLFLNGPNGALPHSDINWTIARLEHWAVSTSQPGVAAASWIWAATLRGFLDGRFQIPCCYMWKSLIAADQTEDLVVPGYVRHWLSHHDHYVRDLHAPSR
jgi:hypothetical protein